MQLDTWPKPILSPVATRAFATDHRGHRSDRYPASARQRCFDPPLGVRLAGPLADPIAVRPGKHPQLRNRCWIQDSCGRLPQESRLRRLLHGKIVALFSPKSHSCRTAIDAEHFMTGAVIMVKRINAVNPRIGPIIGCELFLNSRGRIFAFQIECVTVKEKRIPAVWNHTVIFEKDWVGLIHTGSLYAVWVNEGSPTEGETSSGPESGGQKFAAICSILSVHARNKCNSAQITESNSSPGSFLICA